MIPQKRFHLFEPPKRSMKIKKLCYFPPLLRIGTTRVKTVFLSNCRLMSFMSLTIEIHKNTTETFRVTDKQYFSKSFYQPK